MTRSRSIQPPPARSKPLVRGAPCASTNQSFTFGFYREAEECPNLEAYQILYTRSAISVGKGFTPKNG